MQFTDIEIKRTKKLTSKIEKESFKQLRFKSCKYDKLNVIAKFQLDVDDVCKTTVSRYQNKPDCKKGCTSCCHFEVHVLTPEAVRIYRHLKQNASSFSDDIFDRISTHAQSSGIDLHGNRLPCPFLLDGGCSIYAVRPYMCRKLISFNVADCEAGVQIKEDRGLYIDTAALMVGVSNAHSKAKLQCDTHFLTQILNQFETSSEDVVKHWEQGNSVA